MSRKQQVAPGWCDIIRVPVCSAKPPRGVRPGPEVHRVDTEFSPLECVLTQTRKSGSFPSPLKGVWKVRVF